MHLSVHIWNTHRLFGTPFCEACQHDRERSNKGYQAGGRTRLSRLPWKTLNLDDISRNSIFHIFLYISCKNPIKKFKGSYILSYCSGKYFGRVSGLKNYQQPKTVRMRGDPSEIPVVLHQWFSGLTSMVTPVVLQRWFSHGGCLRRLSTTTFQFTHSDDILGILDIDGIWNRWWFRELSCC